MRVRVYSLDNGWLWILVGEEARDGFSMDKRRDIGRRGE